MYPAEKEAGVAEPGQGLCREQSQAVNIQEEEAEGTFSVWTVNIHKDLGKEGFAIPMGPGYGVLDMLL